MKRFQEFINSKLENLDAGRFANTDMGGRNVQQQIAASRRKIVELLESLLEEGELQPQMTLQQVLDHLRGNV